jgi:hypothetical protein
MPKLAVNSAVAGVDCIDDRAPPVHLVLAVKPGCADDAMPLVRDLRALGDDQPSRGPLKVILYHQWRGSTILGGSRACHRRHNHAIAQAQAGEIEWFE